MVSPERTNHADSGALLTAANSRSPSGREALSQVTRSLPKGFEVYGGMKNLLDFVPKDVLLRPEDPFDEHVDDPVNNPNGHSFDTAYMYAPLQGIRGFLGLRWMLR